MAQDWSAHALVYFYSVGSDLLGTVFYWRLDMEFTDMTQEDIIRMAREAEFDSHGYIIANQLAHLERFAALVAAAEREACAKACEDAWTRHACAAAIRARGNT
jgi:hypothetical protein